MPVMGGSAHLIAVGAPSGALERAAERLRHLEALWSRFRPTSEISLLNARGGAPTVVSVDTLRLVEVAVRSWRLTQGAFDPTVLAAVEALGYDRTFEQVRPQDSIAAGSRPGAGSGQDRRAPGCAEIGCDTSALTVTLPVGCRFDPGGIGKGLAADIVTQQLLDEGAAGACANVGGDVRVRGTSLDGRDWVVGIDDPHHTGEQLTSLVMTDAGLATSSRLLRRWGSDRHHLVDPSTGLPTDNDLDAVSIAAGDAALAEALTKAAFVRGAEAVLPLLNGVGAAGLFVHRDGRVSRSTAWPSD